MKRGAGKAQAAGAQFEAWLDAVHLVALRRGIARIRKVSPAVKWLPGGRAIIVGEAGCDWSGTLRGGRHFVAESKTHDGPRLARSAFEPHQIADLDAAHSLGALAVALVQLTIEGRRRRFAAPWPLAWVEVGRGASVGIVELVEWEMGDGACYLAAWAEGA